MSLKIIFNLTRIPKSLKAHSLWLVLFLSCTLAAQNTDNTHEFKIHVVNINKHKKYKKLIVDAIALLNETLTSEDFKQRVLSKKFDWEKLNGGHEKMSNQQVLDMLIRWTKTANITLKIKPRGLRIKAYISGTMGVTNLNSNKTRTYRHWLDLSPDKYHQTVIGYASHIAHEYAHQRGFSDKDLPKQCTYRDVVPYAIGDIVCAILNGKTDKQYNCNKCSK